MKEKNRDKKSDSGYLKEDKSVISDINKKFIEAVDVVASIELFEEYSYVRHIMNKSDSYNLEDDLVDKFSYIDDIIMNFKHILNMEGVLKSKKIFELYQMKKTLLYYYEEYRFISSYAHHIYRLYTYWCNKNDRYRRKYDLKVFYNGLYSSLKNKDRQTQKNIQQEILSVIPMRVTKEFFMDYIRNSLEDRIEEDPDGAFEVISDIYGIVNEDFLENDRFSDSLHFKHLKAYAELNYRGMSGRRLRKYCNELNEYVVILDTVCEVIWSYTMSINRIMIILLDFDMDYTSLVELEPLVYSAHRYVLSTDMEKQEVNGKLLFYQIRSGLRKWYDILKKCSVNIEGMSDLDLGKGEMVAEELVDFINYFYYLNLLASEDENFDTDDYYDISSDDLYEVLDNIIQDIDSKLDILKPDARRIMISDVMSSVDPGFKSLNEFIGFVKKSVEFDTTDAEKANTIKNINNILDRYSFLN